jgi:GTPase SAR1 family protein
MRETQEEPLLKIIVVGDSFVGKTSLLNMYCYNKFETLISPTIGCDFTTKLTLLDGR